jgi:PIN domain nuclease of toxin-antitoxin system
LAKPAVPKPAVPKPAVFDASAILAILFNEPGADRVIGLLHGALVSSVNLAEVHTCLLLKDRPAAQAWSRVLSMGFEVVPFSEEQARLAGELLADSAGNPRPQAVSLGERACLALAIERGAAVYTTNRAWKSLSIIAGDLEIEVIA